MFSFKRDQTCMFYQFENYFEKYNLCVGTVIDENWILTSATCCKADDIATITFNDYSIFIADKNQTEIISTRFHIHQDLDACLIQTKAVPEALTHIPCLTKVSLKFSNDETVFRRWQPFLLFKRTKITDKISFKKVQVK